MKPYEVRLSRSAGRTYPKLPKPVRGQIKAALIRLSKQAEDGSRGGKNVKTIQGKSDVFHRLRVGQYRVMYEIIEDDHVLLVLGIVDREDLEAWLRSR